MWHAYMNTKTHTRSQLGLLKEKERMIKGNSMLSSNGKRGTYGRK